jgi:hypothetical protein
MNACKTVLVVIAAVIGQIADHRLLLPILQQVNDSALLHVGDDAAKSVHDVQLVYPHPDGRDGLEPVQFLLGVSSPYSANRLNIESDLIGDGRESSLSPELLDIEHQALCHRMGFMHVEQLFVSRLFAFFAEVAPSVHPDANPLPVNRSVEVHRPLSAIPDDLRTTAVAYRQARLSEGDEQLVLRVRFYDALILNPFKVQHNNHS